MFYSLLIFQAVHPATTSAETCTAEEPYSRYTGGRAGGWKRFCSTEVPCLLPRALDSLLLPAPQALLFTEESTLQSAQSGAEAHTASHQLWLRVVQGNKDSWCSRLIWKQTYEGLTSWCKLQFSCSVLGTVGSRNWKTRWGFFSFVQKKF